MQSNSTRLLERVESYSPEMQREIFDFIEFLETKYKSKAPNKTKKKSPLREEAFIGMWKNRPEMKDSIDYVRALRKQQSNRKHF
ncbi:MAG: DUF2281 domain-containing protein [Leptospiraceae bacterium]|nr:DUF2281 domain-containing protein [Leptospiraceae bacterium]